MKIDLSTLTSEQVILLAKSLMTTRRLWRETPPEVEIEGDIIFINGGKYTLSEATKNVVKAAEVPIASVVRSTPRGHTRRFMLIQKDGVFWIKTPHGRGHPVPRLEVEGPTDAQLLLEEYASDIGYTQAVLNNE